jgi:hypothetical protein
MPLNYYNYYTEVEEHFVRRRGKHMWVSPLDWSLIEIWRQSGVPLNVALRGIDIAMDGFFKRPSRRRDKVNTLFFCYDSVMEEYQRHLEAHLGENKPEDASPQPPDGAKEAESGNGLEPRRVLAFLDARITEIKALGAKQSDRGVMVETIDRVITRLEEIRDSLVGDRQADFEAMERDLALLDALLIDGLRPSVEPELIKAWEKEAKTELKVYRKRLPKETYNKILENFMRGKVHAHFNIGELSLFHLS